MALDSYSGLSQAVQDWAERDYDQSRIDEFIVLAEAAINRRLNGYQREITGTLTTDATGMATLPSGFVRFMNFADSNGRPVSYAISGTSVAVHGMVNYSRTLDVTYVANLTPLSTENPTNWLLEVAPDAYLWMVKAQQRAFEEDWEAAAVMLAQANTVLNELSIQSQTSQYGRGGLQMRGVTP